MLHEGYEGLYDEFLFRYNDTIPKEVTEEVYKTLYMYDRAILSYEKLSDSDKEHFLRTE